MCYDLLVTNEANVKLCKISALLILFYSQTLKGGIFDEGSWEDSMVLVMKAQCCREDKKYRTKLINCVAWEEQKIRGRGGQYFLTA